MEINNKLVPVLMGGVARYTQGSLRVDIKNFLEKLDKTEIEANKVIEDHLDISTVEELQEYVDFLKNNTVFKETKELAKYCNLEYAEERLEELEYKWKDVDVEAIHELPQQGKTALLSKHFTHEDLTKTSQKADNTPSPEALANLCHLAQTLDVIYEFMQIFMTSAFRSDEVNDLVGGSKKSMHKKGLAGDFVPKYNSIANQEKLFNFMKEHISFDRLIYYKKRGFFHIAVAPKSEKNRNIIEIR